MDFNIDFGRIFERLFRMFWLIMLVTVITAAVGVVYTWQPKPDIYNSNATLVGAAGSSYSSALSNTYIMRNYSDLVKSEKIARKVVQALPQYNLDALTVQSMVEAIYDSSNSSADSAMFYIHSNSVDPQIAVDVANATAEAFVSELKNVTGADIAIVLDKASSPTIVFSGKSDQLQKRLEFVVVGFLLICFILSIIEIFSKKISQVYDCTLNGTIELLGVIPKYDIN